MVPNTVDAVDCAGGAIAIFPWTKIRGDLPAQAGLGSAIFKGGADRQILPALGASVAAGPCWGAQPQIRNRCCGRNRGKCQHDRRRHKCRCIQHGAANCEHEHERQSEQREAARSADCDSPWLGPGQGLSDCRECDPKGQQKNTYHYVIEQHGGLGDVGMWNRHRAEPVHQRPCHQKMQHAGNKYQDCGKPENKQRQSAHRTSPYNPVDA